MILNVNFFFHGIPTLGDINFEKYFGFKKKIFLGLNFKVKEFPTARTDISTTPTT